MSGNIYSAMVQAICSKELAMEWKKAPCDTQFRNMTRRALINSGSKVAFPQWLSTNLTALLFKSSKTKPKPVCQLLGSTDQQSPQ